MSNIPKILGTFAFVFFLILPAFSWAYDLKIVHVDTPKEGTKAAEANISVYFDYRQGDNQMTVTGINAENCTVNIDGRTPEVLRSEVRPFTEGNQGVGVLFVFPIAKNYSEESFAIRSTLVTLIQLMNRPLDQLNAIPYDVTASPLGWTRASEGNLNRQISELQTTEVVEPNLFSTFQPAISVLENLQNVSQKYLVFISDAEGAVISDIDRSTRLIGSFTDSLKKNNIKPIIIAYSPDGPGAMSNADVIKRIATNSGGAFFKAESTSTFQKVLTSDVYNYIFKQYIYDATLDMSDYDEGKYNLQLVVKTNNTEDKDAVKITWPILKKSKLLLILIIAGIFGGCAAVALIFLVRRNKGDEEEFYDDTPQEVCCATCGKPLPKQLYGFNGEFCLSGGLPDCPYYQMPDRGKIQITKGVMADTTFFIKKDVTTIGSNPDNDIYLCDKSVSRKHAAIKADEGKRYEVRDFGSVNGIYINGEKTERKFLKDGDIIRFGSIETIFKLK